MGVAGLSYDGIEGLVYDGVAEAVLFASSYSDVNRDLWRGVDVGRIELMDSISN